MNPAASSREERCTFCEKSRPMVECLIAGPPKIFICNECVDLCSSILAEELRGETESPGQGGAPASARRLGLSVLPDQLRVVGVVEDGPAAKAGIRVDDVLDHDVKSIRGLITDSELDGQLVLNVRRGDTTMAVMVRLEEPGPGSEVQL